MRRMSLPMPLTSIRRPFFSLLFFSFFQWSFLAKASIKKKQPRASSLTLALLER